MDGISQREMAVMLAYPPGKRQLAEPFEVIYNEDYRPHAVMGWPNGSTFSAFEGKAAAGDEVVAYVCFDGVCKQPTSSPTEMRKLMRREH